MDLKNQTSVSGSVHIDLQGGVFIDEQPLGDKIFDWVREHTTSTYIGFPAKITIEFLGSATPNGAKRHGHN